MTGTMKEWYHKLSAVCQNQFHELNTTATVLGALHEEFIGDVALVIIVTYKNLFYIIRL